MKEPRDFLPLAARRPLLLAVLMVPVALGCGCTTALWDADTFAHQYRPGDPANLRLSYSEKRRDILVQYGESNHGDSDIRPRCYWLEPNTLRVNRNEKPHFVSAKESIGLTPIPMGEGPPDPRVAEPRQLYVMVAQGDDFFTLYSGAEVLNPYKLPVYNGSSQRVKQVLLTPFAVVVDATVIGAVAAYLYGPQILPGLNK